MAGEGEPVCFYQDLCLVLFLAAGSTWVYCVLTARTGCFGPQPSATPVFTLNAKINCSNSKNTSAFKSNGLNSAYVKAPYGTVCESCSWAASKTAIYGLTAVGDTDSTLIQPNCRTWTKYATYNYYYRSYRDALRLSFSSPLMFDGNMSSLERVDQHVVDKLEP